VKVECKHIEVEQHTEQVEHIERMEPYTEHVVHIKSTVREKQKKSIE